MAQQVMPGVDSNLVVLQTGQGRVQIQDEKCFAAAQFALGRESEVLTHLKLMVLVLYTDDALQPDV